MPLLRPLKSAYITEKNIKADPDIDTVDGMIYNNILHGTGFTILSF